MTRETTFNLTLDLPCSAGWLCYDRECRVTVEYGIEAGSVDCKLTEVRLDGEPGVIRKDSPEFFLFKAACDLPANRRIIAQECFDDYDARDKNVKRIVGLAA